MSDAHEARELLGPDGPFPQVIPGFAPRESQQRMAEAVGTAIAGNRTLVVEAGTGTGKTLAYLVPALLSGRKVVISTGTKYLQDQLFHRDLPRVREALKRPVSTALLKGRGNYLCLYRARLQEAVADVDPDIDGAVTQLRTWMRTTRTGDIAEAPGVPEDAPVWARLTSTADNCLGQECEYFSDCHVVRARRAAQAADVVVVNHHLLLADMALKDNGFGEILPSADACILDEAHQLPEVASLFFGQSVTGGQLLELATDSQRAHQLEAGDMPELLRCIRSLEQAVRAFRAALGPEGQRTPWSEVADDAAVTATLRRLAKTLTDLEDGLREAAVRGRALENCHRRAEALLDALRQFQESEPADWVLWFETAGRGFRLHRTPLEVSGVFRQRMSAYPSAWIFTSATLSVANRFEHFLNNLGVVDADTLRLESPFDFRRNALIYAPPDVPDPNAPDYTRAVVKAALPVLAASGGRAFFLFTSHRALREAAAILEGSLPYPVLVQGTRSRRELLAQFGELGNAVLLGTGSFWEGVDVRGAALSCVIIDRLPFGSPDDPVLRARVAALRQRELNPFATYQLPNAVVALKQGVGRLIRDVQDRGVLMLCDPRLRRRSYGRVFVRSLPPMPVTHALADVQRFFAEEQPAAEEVTS